MHSLVERAIHSHLTENRDWLVPLTFLSGTKDDPNHILAMFVIEGAESESLSVLLAINKTNWDDGNHALQQLMTNFEKIEYLLEEIIHIMACSKMGSDTLGFKTEFLLIFTLIQYEQNKSSYSASIAGHVLSSCLHSAHSPSRT
jgi:hypothetical protein